MAKRPPSIEDFKREMAAKRQAKTVGKPEPSSAVLRATYVRHGQETWAQHKSDCTWNGWLAIGDALDIGRTEAMAQAKTDQPKGRGYNWAFSFWLFKHGFNDIDQGDRKRLFDILEHRAEIEQWRATLTLTERLRINHPSTVWRKWRAESK
jgi:hypothetical protein